MADPVETLKALKKTKEFFVGIDSDGCAFDSMEIKHKECFIPNIINSWELQAVSRFARDVAEFVNLYSKWRGVNRFPALTLTLDLLAEHPKAVERGYKAPQVDSLRKWIAEETKLGNPTLEAKITENNDEVLKKTLEWSHAVNADVKKIVRGVPPFPHLRESLGKIAESADAIVCSGTPGEALKREWDEHDIAQYVHIICGQEMGSKTEHLQYAAGGKYEADKILMIGDAPGDMKAAKANDALFYPINPGDEAASWKRFFEEAADKFFAGQYAGKYEDELIAEFNAHLPEKPPWVE